MRVDRRLRAKSSVARGASDDSWCAQTSGEVGSECPFVAEKSPVSMLQRCKPHAGGWGDAHERGEKRPRT